MRFIFTDATASVLRGCGCTIEKIDEWVKATWVQGTPTVVVQSSNNTWVDQSTSLDVSRRVLDDILFSPKYRTIFRSSLPLSDTGTSEFCCQIMSFIFWPKHGISIPPLYEISVFSSLLIPRITSPLAFSNFAVTIHYPHAITLHRFS